MHMQLCTPICLQFHTSLISNGNADDIAAAATTGGGFFVECLRHSAKADIHSAKPLPSVILGKERSVNSLSTKTSLPSANPTLGKEKWP